MSWPTFWSHHNWQTKVLWPLSKLVCWEAKRRLQAFNQAPPEKQTQAVTIVVGNLVVGGSGKTPFIVWLVKQLQAKGLSVGIISRGYGGKSKQWPQLVDEHSDASLVGDEPVLLAKQLGVPIAVSPVRVEAVALLEQHHQCDVIISDDGLQHYALARDIEVVLVDAQRLWGNGLCLPAGPLRESKAHLDQVDFIVYNGVMDLSTEPLKWQSKTYQMTLQPVCFHQVANPEKTLDKQAFSGQSLPAIAGIGNPQRFFDTLTALDIKVQGEGFKDHYRYSETDFIKWDEQTPLLMTEKDAVKCLSLAKADRPEGEPKNWWYLEVAPQASAALFDNIYAKVTSKLPAANLNSRS